jgi:hypothetical protein
MMKDLFNHKHEAQDRAVATVILEDKYGWELKDHPNPKEKCIDLLAYRNGVKVASIEIEHRSGKSTGYWGKDNITYPYERLSIPFRKWKLIQGFNPHYVVLSDDYYCWGIIPPDVIKEVFRFNLPSELEYRPRDSRGEPINRTSKDMPKHILDDLINTHGIEIRNNSNMYDADWGDMFFNVPSNLIKWGHAVGK